MVVCINGWFVISAYRDMLFLTHCQDYLILITFQNSKRDFRSVNVGIFPRRNKWNQVWKLSRLWCKFHSFMVVNLIAFLPVWRTNGWFAVIVFHAVLFLTHGKQDFLILVAFQQREMAEIKMTHFFFRINEMKCESLKACYVSHVSFTYTWFSMSMLLLLNCHSFVLSTLIKPIIFIA